LKTNKDKLVDLAEFTDYIHKKLDKSITKNHITDAIVVVIGYIYTQLLNDHDFIIHNIGIFEKRKNYLGKFRVYFKLHDSFSKIIKKKRKLKKIKEKV
jgi:hypothetical protein